MQLHRVVNEAGKIVGYATSYDGKAVAYDEVSTAIDKLASDNGFSTVDGPELFYVNGLGHDVPHAEILRMFAEPFGAKDFSIKYYVVKPSYGFKLSHKLNAGGSMGNLTKWIFEDMLGKSWVKGRRKSWTMEPEAEVCAYRLARLFGIDATPQDFIMIPELSNKRLSISRDYAKGLTAMSLFRYLHMVQKKKSKDFFGLEKFQLVESVLNDTCKEAHRRTLWFDYIIGNEDRHLRNIEVLLDDNGKVVSLAPMFDMGSSLFSEDLDIDIEQACARKENYSHSKPYANPQFNQIAVLREAGCSPNLLSVRKEEIYKTVNSCFTGKRAKLLGAYVCKNTERLGLLL